MIKKKLHNTTMVTIEELIKNWEYLIKASDNLKRTVTVKKRNKIVAVLFTPCTFEKTDAEIEKLEASHQDDQFKIKKLRKENEILKARLELLEKLNEANNSPFK